MLEVEVLGDRSEGGLAVEVESEEFGVCRVDVCAICQAAHFAFVKADVLADLRLIFRMLLDAPD